jgi:hypothetical protein
MSFRGAGRGPALRGRRFAAGAKVESDAATEAFLPRSATALFVCDGSGPDWPEPGVAARAVDRGTTSASNYH